MQSLTMSGVGKLSGGEYEAVNIDGVFTCTDSIRSETMKIEGVFKCSGAAESGLLQCRGVADFKAGVKAKTLEIEGVMNVKSGKIEAVEINCEGVLSAKDEITADTINVYGFIGAEEIFGDNVTIKTDRKFFERLLIKKYSTAELIEATTIKLSGVKANTVGGRDITIGSYCEIDTIDCSGTLHIDDSSSVRNITGNYTRV